MKILITGINGLVGKDIGRFLGFNSEYELFGIGRSSVCYAPGVKYTALDLTNETLLNDYLKAIKPNVIIHSAAMTKLDECEADHDKAVAVNVTATKILAEYGCRIIYMSSDGVFNGEKGHYSETDLSDAKNFYGKTKAMGEKAVFENNNAVALRMSIYGYNINNNTSVTQWAAQSIKKGIAINGFNDVFINPVYTSQIVYVMRILLNNDYTGILNLGCDEIISKYDLFCMIAEKMGLNTDKIKSVSVDTTQFKAPRTKNTSLKTEVLKKEFGVKFSISDGLDEFYQDYLRWI